MALSVYKRIRPEPVRLILNGKPVIVRGGQTVIAETRDMMGVSGFAFIKMHDQRDQFVPANSNLVVTKPNPIIDMMSSESPMSEMSVQVQSITNQEFTPKPSIVDVAPIKEITVEEIKKPSTVIGFNPETIEKLKNFDNKQWFALKKEDIIKFLEDANIDYQHISSDKWELLKFLKKIIKEL
jgi:hypothetical protein